MSPFGDSPSECPRSGTVPLNVPVRGQSLLNQRQFVADGDFAALDDAREHASLALQLGAETVSELVHPVARVADHRDLELGLAGAHALADRPLLDVCALDGDVLADRAGLDVHRVEVFLRDEENFALRRVRVRAALQTLAHDCVPPLVRLGAAALPSG